MQQRLLTSLLLILLSSYPAYAQPGPGRAGLPAVGSKLPTVEAFDENGNVFSTASLRGSHSVLVFGCLT